MNIQTTINLAQLREIVPDPATATDEQIAAAASLIPGTSIHFGQHSPDLADLTYADVTHIVAVLDQVVRRGLNVRPITLEV